MAYPKLVIAGGGTGGHVFPGIAIAKEMQKKAPVDVHFIGTKRGLEAKIVPKEGYFLHFIQAEGFRKRGIKKIRSIFKLMVGFIQSIFILKRLKPELVLAMGGYASLAPAFAALALKKPLFLHEQNISLGLSNQILFPFCKKMFLSYEESLSQIKNSKKVSVVGNPIRMELFEGKKSPYRFGLDDKKRVILIFGGSQGSRIIDEHVLADLDLLAPYKEKLAFIHQAGERNIERVKKCYKEKGFLAYVDSFIYDMANAYATSDLVISRSGASTLAELTALGKPSILIPFMRAAGAHQEKNAYALQEKGGCVVVKEKELSYGVLGEKVLSLVFDEERLKTMGEKAREMGKPLAAQMIADACWEAIGA